MHNRKKIAAKRSRLRELLLQRDREAVIAFHARPPDLELCEPSTREPKTPVITGVWLLPNGAIAVAKRYSLEPYEPRSLFMLSAPLVNVISVLESRWWREEIKKSAAARADAEAKRDAAADALLKSLAGA